MRIAKNRVVVIVICALLYGVGYLVARDVHLKAIENYPFGKGGPRHDFIAVRTDRMASSILYWAFLPAIVIEEQVLGLMYNRYPKPR